MAGEKSSVNCQNDRKYVAALTINLIAPEQTPVWRWSPEIKAYVPRLNNHGIAFPAGD